MRKQDISILLLFLMLVTPIASAFKHCVGMDMSMHSSVSQNYTVLLSADNGAQPEHKKMLHMSQNNQTDMDCHNNNACTFHVCGTHSITSTAPIINIASSSYYSIFEYASHYSTVSFLNLRPPIFIL